MENRSIFQYILGQLSVLSDEELSELDFISALSRIDSTDIPDEDKKSLKKLFSVILENINIKHHGVKGMKWGVRRFQDKNGRLTAKGKQRYQDDSSKQSVFKTPEKFQIRSKNGEVISAVPLKKWSIGQKILYEGLLGIKEKEELGRRGDANYTLTDSKGKKMGELSLISKNKDVAYLDWIAVDKKHRGNGYATDIINDLLHKAKKSGYSKVELNALKKPRKLYERLGFTYTDTSEMSIMSRINSFEFGCKHMEYDLNKLQHFISGDYFNNHQALLKHYGVLGMKWGVRRDMKRNTSPPGNKRVDKSEKASRNKRIIKAAIMTATVTSAAIYVHRNQKAIGKYMSRFKGLKVKELDQKFKDKGKEYIKNALKGVKEGVDEAVKEAPKKAAKTVITGMVLNQTKKTLDSVIGKEESAKIFQANDNKKIGKFWKTSPEDKDD